ELGGNDGDRIFTWNWPNHGKMGFSMGSNVNQGANNATSYHWENGNENHAIPYTEIYIRLEAPDAPELADTDEDGIFDIVEQSIAGDLDTLTAGDDDGDGLDSPAEINTHGTDPTVADGDGDGLNDGAEITAGTDPANADSDGDSISDGDEVTAGTNPLSSDTDGDGFSDPQEVALGSDAADADDTPQDGARGLKLYLDFENGEVADASGNGTTVNSTNGDLGINADGSFPSSTSSAAGNFDGNAYLKIPGIDTRADLGTYTLSAWIKPNDLGDRYVFGQDSQGFHIGIRSGGRLHQAHWGSDKNANTQLANHPGYQDDGWVHATYTYDTATKVSHRYLDGVLDGTSNGDHNPPNLGNALMIGRINGGQDGNKFLGLMDDVAVWNRVLTANEVRDIYRDGIFYDDTDGDGLPDPWEIATFGDLTSSDGTGDFDEDGLTDTAERNGGTDPANADSDSDGLNDGAEITAGTDPANGDSDGDGLNDGDEVNTHGTDPLERDTDGDDDSDGAELALGTSPTDADDNLGVTLVQPSFPTIIGSTPGVPVLPNEDVAGMQYREEHHPGGVLKHNNSAQNWNRIVLDPASWPPTTSTDSVQPWFDHGNGGFNTPGGGNRPWTDGGGDNFCARMDGYVYLLDGTYNIHLGADDTNYFVIDTGAGGTKQTAHNCCPNNHTMEFTIARKGWYPFANLMVEEGGGDWGDMSISQVGGFGRVGLGDVDNGSPRIVTIKFEDTDSDEDGLQDWWENLNFGDLTTSDGSTDVDNDGSTDADEYTAGTDPTDDDSDDDGLNDGAEATAGTNPLNADSDGDGLNDGAEATAGTDPLDTDSDDDKFSDGAEVAGGSDPTNANSYPDPDVPLGDGLQLHLDFEGGEIVDKSGNETAISLQGGTVVEHLGAGAPDGSSPDGGLNFSGGHIRTDPDSILNSHTTLDKYTLSAWIKPDRDNDGQERFVFGQVSQGIHHGIRNNMYLHHAHWGADTNGGTQLKNYLENGTDDDDGWIHAVWTYSGNAGDGSKVGQIYLDGKLDGQWNKNRPNQGNGLIVGGRNGGEAQYRGQIDEVAVWNRVLSAGDVNFLFLKGVSTADPIPLAITAISTAGTTDNVTGVTLTFSNTAGTKYKVERSSDLLIWEELDDDVDGPDYTDENPPAGSAWYRVSELTE
ncbi:MAG: LamG domain-containing protein, partial [Verrucomicrobiaceae bacterium]|nr:LamG domain-containing protein [Verrucomicrobiaceae bacterium]